MYSFLLNEGDDCPKCHRDLNETNALTLDGHLCSVNAGRIVESEDCETDIILDDPCATLVCTSCGAELDYTRHKEED